MISVIATGSYYWYAIVALALALTASALHATWFSVVYSSLSYRKFSALYLGSIVGSVCIWISCFACAFLLDDARRAVNAYRFFVSVRQGIADTTPQIHTPWAMLFAALLPTLLGALVGYGIAQREVSTVSKEDGKTYVPVVI